MIGARRTAQAAASLAAVAGLLVVGLPRVTGADWPRIGEQLEVLSIGQAALLLALWLLGLYSHTYVATAALPELTHRRALGLNLSGSAVSNLVPFGGALGMALNYAMVRSWGHQPGSFGPFTTLTTLWNVLVKLALPVVALGLLVASGALPTPGLTLAALAAAGSLLVIVVAVALVLSSDRLAGAVGRIVQGVVARALRALRSARTVALDRQSLELRARVAGLLRRGWLRMLLAMLLYAALQAALLWLVLAMLGSTLGPVATFAGFAFGRALTLFVVTPGGVGVTETGSAALLIGLGGEPATVAAGTVLFSAITFGLEIPLGGIYGLLWWRRHRRVRGRA